MDVSALEEIGLTGAEIKVFIALNELGLSSAGKIVEKSKLQNAVVHRAFHSLAEKGLLSSVYQGRIRKYSVIEPKQLISFLDERKIKLMKLLPELEAKKKLAIEKSQVMMFQGIRGVKELLSLLFHTSLKNTSKEYLSYGGPQKAHEILEDYFWEGFHNKRIEQKIAARLLFNHDLRWWGNALNKKKYTTVRFTARNFEEITETIIYGNKVAIIIYLETPSGFLLESAEAAKSYRLFFELLWKQAKK